MGPLTAPEIDNNAWKRAWRMRCCPPDAVLYASEDAGMLNAHLEICPWCRADQTDGLPVPSFAALCPVNSTSILPGTGELWLIKAELGGWGEKVRYYNGPVVLVIEDFDEKMVNVLQIYDDDYFKGPEDVPLGNDLAGFAEPWNRYSLCRDDLVLKLGEVTRDVLETCKAATKGPSTEIEQGSLLWFFRNMEVETGFYFAQQSIAKVMKNMEADRNNNKTAWFDTVSSSQLLLQLQHLTLQCNEPLPADASTLDVLAYCSLPDDRLPLAAADTKKTGFAIVFILGSGSLESYSTCTFELHQTDVDGNSLMVSGTVPEEAVDFDEFHCWWKTDGKMIAPVQGQSGYANKVFWATFSREESFEPQDNYEIVIRCIKYL
jgi:hypothetical protein